MDVVVLDGPIGTELHARGVPTPLPGWSAHALETDPTVVAAIHADYAAAGARVHTTCTFRTRPDVLGDRWEALARNAVQLARDALPRGHRVAGSIAPLRDCYRPDLSPADTAPERTRSAHAELARLLADAGCDLLLCETFPHAGEALLAVEAAVATGLPTWVALTPGPNADLLSPVAVAAAAARAVDAGAEAVLVNCLPADHVVDYVRALCAFADVPIGAYANAGRPDDRSGRQSAPGRPDDYAALAATWRDAGASIVGGCCGTGPAHVAALATRFA